MSFHALNVAYELLEKVSPLLDAIKARNPALADQADRAMTSIVLNLEEAQHRRGKDRMKHHRYAGGSASELRAALRIAVCHRFLPGTSVPWELLDREVAMTYRLVWPSVPTAAPPSPRTPGRGRS